MPIKRSSPKKQEEILDAFGRLLQRTEYKSITMREIAGEADTSLGAITYYFSGKTDILIAYYEKVLDAYVEFVRGWTEEIDPDISSFASFFAAFTDFTMRYFSNEEAAARQSQHTYTYYYALMAETPELQRLVDEKYRQCADALVAAIARTRMPCRDPRALAYALMALWDGFSLFSENGISPYARNALFSSVRDMVSGKEE